MADAAHALERFVAAQEPVYNQVCTELARGRKTSHWMWFIFPQLAGLGLSDLAQYYGITSLAEALAYLQHPVLGARLREHTELVNQLQGSTLLQIFGTPDELKFRSCMTLFEQVARTDDPFAAALTRYCGGQRCSRTLALLQHGT